MKRIILPLLFLSLVTNFCLAQNPLIDSLKTVIAKRNEDTLKVNAYTSLAVELRKSNLDTAIIVGKEGLALATKIKWKKGIGFANHILGVISYMKDEKTQSMAYNNTAIAIWKELANSTNKSEAAYGKLYIAKSSITNANIFIDQANYSKALEYSFNALKTVEELGDKKVQGVVLGNIGNIYATQKEYDKALEHYNKAFVVGSEMEDPIFILNQLSNIANAYKSKGDSKKAFEYYTKTLKKAEEFGVKSSQASSIGNIGQLYVKEKKYDEAIANFKLAIVIAEEIGDKGLLIFNLTNLGGIYWKIGKYQESEKNLLEALKLAEEIGDPKYLMAVEDNLGNLYDDSGKPALALEHFKNYIIYRDSITNQQNRKDLFRSEINYEFEKKELTAKAEQDKKDAIAEEEKQQQKMILYFVAIGGLLVVFFSVWLYKRYKITQKQKLVIEHQKQIVEEHQKDIIDSITYAKRLQDAILPPIAFINNYVPENFVLYKPKDIVAGDFYWAESVGDLFFIAAADSTGHGVPGAMVSVVCSNALNRTLKEFKETETGKILDKTRELVVETFEKSTNEVKDGMDISLLCIDKKNNAVYWSGANNPLWYASTLREPQGSASQLSDNAIDVKKNLSNEALEGRDATIIEVKADKQPIGKTEKQTKFTTHKINCSKGTIFYLFTDGFADQFGGPNGKKFKYKALGELLIKNVNLSMNEQSSALDKAFEDWKGNLEQVDDVCIIGVRL